MQQNHQISLQQQPYGFDFTDSPNKKFKTEERHTEDYDQQIEREVIERQKRYLIYKLKNQTEKTQTNWDKNFESSNIKLKTLPCKQGNNLWDQISNFNGQQTSYKQYIKRNDPYTQNQDLPKRNLKTQYSDREFNLNNDKLLEEIKKLKDQNAQLRRTITQINMLSDNYIKIINEIQKDLNYYKVSLTIRDETIQNLKNLDIANLDIKICVQREIQLHKQIQKLQIDLQLTNQKLNNTIQDFMACFKDKEKYQEIIFQQECQKKIYKRYFIDFLNLYQKMQDDKNKVFDWLDTIKKAKMD